MRHSSRTNYYEGSDSSNSDNERPTRRSTRLSKSRRIVVDDYDHFYHRHPENNPPRKRRKLAYNIRKTAIRRYSLEDDFDDDEHFVNNRIQRDKENIIVEDEDHEDHEDHSAGDRNSSPNSGKAHAVIEHKDSLNLDENELNESLQVEEPQDDLPQQEDKESVLAGLNDEPVDVEPLNELNKMEQNDYFGGEDQEEEAYDSDDNESDYKSVHESSSDDYESQHSIEPDNTYYSFRRRTTNRNANANTVSTKRTLRKKKDFRPFTDYQSTQHVINLIEQESKKNKKKRIINYTKDANDSNDSDDELRINNEIKEYDAKQNTLRDMIQSQVKERISKSTGVSDQEEPVSWSLWFYNYLCPPNTDITPKTGYNSIPGDSRYLTWYDYLARGSNALKDKQPVQLSTVINDKIPFSDLAGLDDQINQMKEMVILPLLYPQLYTTMGITPPKGVLFTGLPGTGKTLLAKTLASQYSNITFFVRKGADILSKWVGEAEKQLKTLFDQAMQQQPSIIFFDEIDGLAPTRTGKQDQIHASIVATLLALMDGCTNRGNVIVIGATNRVDNIDSALRRPGRFDKELAFSLPNLEARIKMMNVNCKLMQIPNKQALFVEIAKQCESYCGADMKYMCTEAAMIAIRRNCPFIYNNTDSNTSWDFSSLSVTRHDFIQAVASTIPSSLRNINVSSLRPLLPSDALLVQHNISLLVNAINHIQHTLTNGQRILLIGEDADYVCRGALNHTCSILDFKTILTSNTAINDLFKNAMSAESIIYMPRVDEWLAMLGEHEYSLLEYLLNSNVLVVATCVDYAKSTSDLFNLKNSKLMRVDTPSKDALIRYYGRLLSNCVDRLITDHTPVAIPAVVATTITDAQIDACLLNDEFVLRELRIALRSITLEIIKDKQYKMFIKPIDPHVHEDYYSLIKKPICLTDVVDKIDQGGYLTIGEYLDDLDLIRLNCIKYNRLDVGYRLKANLMMEVVVSMISRINKDLLVECEKAGYRALTSISRKLNKTVEECRGLNLKRMVEDANSQASDQLVDNAIEVLDAEEGVDPEEGHLDEHVMDQDIPRDANQDTDQEVEQNTDLHENFANGNFVQDVYESMDKLRELDDVEQVPETDPVCEKTSEKSDVAPKPSINLSEASLKSSQKKRILLIMAKCLTWSIGKNAGNCLKLGDRIKKCWNEKMTVDMMINMIMTMIEDFK
eukprot:NODE_195_length_15388_cov_0.563926.p1 type:complete len:1192 gc:universal NODE_195_length_15388_cov_0.563926:5614-2039(-)